MEPNTQSPKNTAETNPQQPSEAELFKLAAETAAKHGADGSGIVPPSEQPKRRGRPPIHGRYSKAFGSDGKKPVPLQGIPDTSAETEPVEMGGDPEMPYDFPPDLLPDTAREICSIVEEGVQGLLRSKQRALKLNLPEADAVIESCAMGEGRKDFIAKLSPYVMQEWGLQPKVSPTVAVLFSFALFGKNIFASIKALEAAAKAQQPQQPPQNATSP